MALFPSGGAAVKGRVLASFPSTVEGTGGIAVSKSNGVWTIEPAWDDLSVETTLADASDRQLWIYNPGTDVYTRLSVQYLLDNLPAGPSGDDGSLIFVQNSAPATDKPEGSLWVDADSTDLDLYQLVSSVWTDTTANLKGATGATGATGPAVGVQFTYSTTTTDSDPGSGIFRFNNATIASATAGYFDNNDAGGSSVTAWLDTFDDSTTTHKGYLIVRGVTTQSAWAIFSVTGSVTDGTGYRKLTLTYIAHGGTWTNGETFAFGFSRTGDKGSDGAGTGDVTAAAANTADNRVVRTDGSSGKGIQESVINLDDTTGTLYPQTNDSGALGKAAQSWSDLFLASGGVINFNNGNVTVTHDNTNKSIAQGSNFDGLSQYAVSNASTGNSARARLAVSTGNSNVYGLIDVFNNSGSEQGLLSFGAGVENVYFTFGSVTPFQWNVSTGLGTIGASGFAVTAYNIGTVSSGTTTPSAANGNYQYYTNNGAHTIAAPANDTAIDILVTNGASAGSITFSGFTVGSSTGSTYATTNTNKYILSIRRINSVATYSWYALQ